MGWALTRRRHATDTQSNLCTCTTRKDDLQKHYLVLDQRPSFSFTFDFLRDDKISGRFIETSLRLHVEDKKQVVLLGLLRDF